MASAPSLNLTICGSGRRACRFAQRETTLSSAICNSSTTRHSLYTVSGSKCSLGFKVARDTTTTALSQRLENSIFVRVLIQTNVHVWVTKANTEGQKSQSCQSDAATCISEVHRRRAVLLNSAQMRRTLEIAYVLAAGGAFRESSAGDAPSIGAERTASLETTTMRRSDEVQRAANSSARVAPRRFTASVSATRSPGRDRPKQRFLDSDDGAEHTQVELGKKPL
eukprot:6188659-Pleurochrysis_carterae.AAC.3